MKLIIDSMSHKDYLKLVRSLGKSREIISCDCHSQRRRALRIKSINRVEGNPPMYRGILLEENFVELVPLGSLSPSQYTRQETIRINNEKIRDAWHGVADAITPDSSGDREKNHYMDRFRNTPGMWAS